MPNPSHSGWNGVPWHICDRCGFWYPVAQLRRQGGLIICHKDWDNPIHTITNDRRQSVIAARLSEPGDEPALAEIIKTTDGDVDDFG